jgi:DUF4097 and DUF4098 domain-containing protein YvlB
MKIQLFTATALVIISTAAFAIDSQFERTLTISGQPDVYVSTGSGNVTVHPGSDNQIHIVGHVHAGWSLFGMSGSVGGIKDRIQRIVDNPPIVQSGNTVRIGESSDHELFNNISIDYDISTPANAALNLHSGSGDIDVDHVGRYLSAGSGSGNVRAHGVHGPAELGSGSGDIELEEDAQGDVKAKTGSGNVQIHGLNGGLMARSGSGDIEADGRLSGAANLSSGSGNIKLHLTPDAHFNLEASTGSGDIHVNYPGAPEQGDNSRHHLTAPINGGGAPLEVRTGSGNVEIDSH